MTTNPQDAVEYLKARLGPRRYRIARMRFASRRIVPPTHLEIARRLGVSRQSVSKDLKFIRRVMRELAERDRARSAPPRSRAA